MRLGGVYALERIARDSSIDHGPIVEVLTASIRSRTPREKPHEGRKIAADVQAILQVLGRRNVANDDPRTRLLLSHTNLSTADLGYGNFERFWFMFVDLSSSYLLQTRFAGGHFSDSVLDDIFAQFADFRDADFENCSLRGARLVEADVRGANFTDADLSGAALKDIVHDSSTIWPAGFDLEEALKREDPIEDAVSLARSQPAEPEPNVDDDAT